MSGHVYYRFKSQKDFQRIMFDGIGISVWDLKREIIQDSKMGKGTDFDFAIYNADTDEEYSNDHTIIPRSSSVIARRSPPKRAGHGNAQQYVNATVVGSGNRTNAPLTAHADWRGGGAISMDFRKQTDSNHSQPPAVTAVLTGGERDSEAESMAAMFAAQDQQWQKTQEAMATATRVGRNMGFRDRGQRLTNHGGMKARENGSAGGGGAGSGMNGQQSQAPPPQGYICYRCGQKGHWIQACPTNDNPEFEGRPRIKRTTGIPKSFLQKVEGKPVDGQNVMVTADGSFVIARPDDASWKQHKSVVVKNLSAADIENQRPSDPDLACSLCSTLLKLAVKMVCCQSSFCEHCISGYLKEHSGVCPECETKVSSTPSKAFVADAERRTRSAEYVADLLRMSKEQVDASTEGEPKKADEPTAGSTEEEEKSSESQATGSKEAEPSQPGSETVVPPEDTVKDASADLLKVPPAEPSSGNSLRSSAPTSATSASSHRPPGMSGMVKDYDGHLSPMNMHGNMPMMGGMGMGMGIGMGMGVGMGMGCGMGYGQQHGMLMGKGMDPMMMGGMGGNHNVVMSSNQVGMYGGPMHGNGMGMDMGGVGVPDGMLGMQMNHLMMMMQNPQLSEPTRMQLMMQQQNLYQQMQQMTMAQRMGGANGMMESMNGMGLGGGPNGMLMNHVGRQAGPGNYGQHHHPHQQDFGRPNSFGGHAPHNNGPGHYPSPTHQHQHRPQARQAMTHHHQLGSSAYQRPPLANGVGRRNWTNNHHGGNVGKRKRPEDLIELESGEKVPRYM